MLFLGSRRCSSPTGGPPTGPTNNFCIYNLIRLLPCTALPVVVLVLFDLLLSPLTTGTGICGWRQLPTLFGNMITPGPISNDKRRRAEEDEAVDVFESGTTQPSKAEKHHATKHQTHESPIPLRSPSLTASYDGRKSPFVSSSSEPVLPDFTLDLSTQENYATDTMNYYGPFKDIRAILDHNYHGNYRQSRQEFQDKIVELLISKSTVRDSISGRSCKTPLKPWIVFTAGVMVSIVNYRFCYSHTCLGLSIHICY